MKKNKPVVIINLNHDDGFGYSTWYVGGELKCATKQGKQLTREEYEALLQQHLANHEGDK